MLMIRLQRIGRKNDPAFRVLVLEKTRSPKAGSYTDLLGTYNPKTKAFTIAADRLKDWMGKGAQVSPTLHNLLVNKGVLEGKKTAAVVSKSNLEKNVAKRAEEAAAASAAAAEAEAAAKAAAEAPVEAPAAEEAASSPEAIEEAAIADAEPAPEAGEAPVEAPAKEETPAA